MDCSGLGVLWVDCLHARLDVVRDGKNAAGSIVYLLIACHLRAQFLIVEVVDNPGIRDILELQRIARPVLYQDDIVLLSTDVSEGFMQVILDGVVVVLLAVSCLIDFLLYLLPPAVNLYIYVVVHLRLQSMMPLNVWMPNAINSDVVQLMTVVVIQIEIYQILYSSSLYSRNG